MACRRVTGGTGNLDGYSRGDGDKLAPSAFEERDVNRERRLVGGQLDVD